MDKTPRFEWMTEEYTFVERSTDWFWAVGLAAVALAVVAILFGDALFGVVIILGAASIAMLSIRRPETVAIAIGERGIKIREVFYRYSDIPAFWVDERPDGNELIIMTKRFFLPQVAIPLHEIDADAVREFLKEKIEEKEMREPRYHKILEMIGL